MSLDVALGSIGSSLLAVNVVGVKMPSAYWFILPLCVWIIYTADHLLDTFKIKDKLLGGRHYFHLRHRKLISVLLFSISLLALALIVMLLNMSVIIFGSCICFLILLYLLLNFWKNTIFKFFPREFIISIGYIAGTWGLPLLAKPSPLHRSGLMVLICYFLIILSIPLLYSIYEYDSDKTSGFISFATTFGIETTGIFVKTLLYSSFFLSGVIFMFFFHTTGFMLIIMTLLLLFAVNFRKTLAHNENYRAICDSINFLPFLFLI